MLKSNSLIHHSALVFSTFCLLASLPLCLLTPEGALFLFITGCSWLGLSCLAQTRDQEEKSLC
jgi:hypothetical protein